MTARLCNAVVLSSMVALAACQSSGSAARVDPEVAMARMMELGQPGTQHQHLARFVGDWNCEMTTWMAPGAPPETMNASSHNELIMGGRYLHQSYLGDFAGQPFEGVGLLGYDNATGSYWSSWIDNFSTFQLTLNEGTASEDGRSIELTGSWFNPFQELQQQDRHVVQVVGENHYTLDMYVSYPGEDEFRSMHIDYRR